MEWIDNFKIQNNKPINFWDVGANIGLYSIYASAKYDNINVISFEPSTSNLRILSRNISINNLESKIKICQLPLTNINNEFLTLDETEFIEGYSMNTFGAGTDSIGEKIISKNKYKILGTSINYLLKNNILSIPNYIKIDVDGIEHFILEGANEYLNNSNLRGLLIELNIDYKEQFETVIKIMTNNNFKIVSHIENYQNSPKIINYIFERE